jgi:hypothetical protein
MLQEYVLNVSAVSVLCCSTCFHGRKCQVFYLMLHMFHTYVASVCFKYFIRFIGCCIQMFHVARISYCLESQWAQGVMVARHGRRRMGHDKLETDGRGATGRDVRAGQGGWL